MVSVARGVSPVPSRAASIVLTSLPPIAVAVLVTLAIWPGLMPGVGFWDTGEFQTVLPILGTAHPTGYPTYVLLGFVVNVLLTPLGEPAFRMNVLSLLCVAIAAAATVRLVTRLTGVVPVAVAAGLGLGLSPAAWRVATHADPHTLHLALVAILFGLLVQWEIVRRSGEPGNAAADRWLVAAAVTFGLAAGNHSLTLLLAVPIGAYVLSVDPGIIRRPRLVVTCAVALVGALALVYLELPLRAGPFRAPLVYAKPNTWDGFWYVALGEQFRGSLHDPLGDLPRKLGDLVGLARTEFGFLSPLIPVAFLATLIRHPRFALLTGTSMLVTVLFNASYTNADIGRYYLGPVLWAWLWLAVLAAVVVESLGAGGEDGPRAAPAAVAVALGLALLVPTVADFRHRAEVGDRHDATAAARWLDAALSEIAENAVVVSWWSTSTPLWYAQYVEGRRTDLTIVDDRTRLDLDYGEATDVIARFLGKRPVYVIRANAYDLAKVVAIYDLVPVRTDPAGDVYLVIGAKGGGG